LPLQSDAEKMAQELRVFMAFMLSRKQSMDGKCTPLRIQPSDHNSSQQYGAYSRWASPAAAAVLRVVRL
ncbi:hypothetical protein ACTXPD_19335, partial [Vreelandella alkaliphila]|uniref:hypothetical protein n=1 Tax=Vreelandella alkaliphila TaxID=272774 RepID=UPI003FD76B92